ncbi:uncharacterized protein DS421_4g117790 [Arachis hypogaea]|nr:uncharacterized protein DS421_4g117790 [Arachis hypogaea]
MQGKREENVPPRPAVDPRLAPGPPSFDPSASRRARLRERETRKGENGSEAELRSNHRVGVHPRRRRTRRDLQPRRCQSCLLCHPEAQLLLGTMSLLMGCAGKPLPLKNVTAAPATAAGDAVGKGSCTSVFIAAGEVVVATGTTPELLAVSAT